MIAPYWHARTTRETSNTIAVKCSVDTHGCQRHTYKLEEGLTHDAEDRFDLFGWVKVRSDNSHAHHNAKVSGSGDSLCAHRGQ